MSWFRNMKISAKLITSFIIISLITGVMGAFAIINMQHADKDYTELYIDYGIAIGDLGSVGIDFNNVRVKTNEIIQLDNEAAKQKLYDEIKKLDKDIESNLAKFEPTIRTKETRQIFDTLVNTLTQYRAVRDKSIYLALSDQNDNAATVLYSEASQHSQHTEELLNQLFDIRKENGRKITEDLSAQAKSTSITMGIVVLFTVMLAVGLGIFISRMISQPVRKLVESADKIADGDLNVEIDIYTTDEIGDLAAAFRKMSDNLNDTMSNIQTAAEQVAAGSKQVSVSSISLSQGATEQASSVEELTASIEEIASQTQQNANYSNEANLLAETAKDNAIHGNAQMKEMLKAMNEINIAAENISKIIKVIDEIAFQTNILALNAAVEAARAGQHGKGFAVVAEEVRNLAARSANAAKETTEMIEGSIKKVEGGTKIAKETAVALENIVFDVAKVASLIGDIAKASNEQAVGINQINQGIMQVSQVIQANSATSEESAAASEELSSQAELMKEQVSRFSLKKNQLGSYKGIEEISPELMQLFEQMSEKKKARVLQGDHDMAHHEVAAAAASHKRIVLSDYEFGKY